MVTKGINGDIRIASTITGLDSTATNVAGVQTVSHSKGHGLEAIYQWGSREIREVKDGNITISFSMMRHFDTDNVAANAAMDTPFYDVCGANSTADVREYAVGIYPDGYVSTYPEIVLVGKFGNWALDGAQDGVIEESADFVGRTQTVGTI